MTQSVPPGKMWMETQSSPVVNKKLRDRIWDCQQKGEFCDVILETDSGDLVLAHRVIVASSSPVLHSMLVDPNICNNDEKTGMQTLKLPEITKGSLQDLIRFAYLGDVQQINVDTVSLWERFQIYEPINLSVEAPNIKDSVEEKNPTTSKPEPEKTGSEVESEHDSCSVDEDNASLEDWDDPNDSDYEEEISNKRKSTPQKPTSDNNKDENIGNGDSEHIATRKRKRKCSFPKHVETKEEVPFEEESSEDNVPIQTFLKKKKVKSKATESSDNKEEDIKSEEEYKPRPVQRKKAKPKKAKKAAPVKVKKPPKPPQSALTHCSSCNIGFDTPQQYQEHRKALHNKHHTCIECGMTFKRLNRLKAHRVTNHPQEGLPQPTWHYCKAEDCKYKSVYSDVVDQHYKYVHVKQRSICETCGSVFAKPYLLKLHRRRAHDRNEAYKCEQCEAIFSLPNHLKLHVKRVHEKSKRFLCDQCPFSSFDKEAVTVHMFAKHNVPLPVHRTTYTCPHCDYKTHTKSVITAHIERHEGHTFKCNLCDSIFQCNRDLQGHYRLRHSQKPQILHHCPYEGCKYASKYGPTTLKNHISRMHENKDYKPFACEICNYRTNVKGNLHLHIRKVHKLQPQIQQRRVKKCNQEDQDVPTIPTVPPEEFPRHNDSPNPHLIPNLKPIPNTHPDPVPTTINEGFQVCPPAVYQDISTTRSATTEVPPTYSTLTTAETMVNRLPASVPMMPNAQFGLMMPNFGYDESLYARPQQNQMN